MPNNENGLWFLNFPNGPTAATFNAPLVSVDVNEPSDSFSALKNNGVSGSAQDLFFYSFDNDFQMDGYSVTLTENEYARIKVLEKDFVVGDTLDIQMRVELGEQSPGIHTLISRWQTGRESFEVFIDAEGKLNFTKMASTHIIREEFNSHIQTDVPTVSTYTSDVPLTNSWFRITHKLSERGTDVLFAQSEDRGNWSIIGTKYDDSLDIITAGDHINIMGSEYGFIPTGGKVYEVIINDISVNFEDALPTKSTFVSNGNKVEFHFKDSEGYDPKFSIKRDRPYIYIPAGEEKSNITLPLRSEFANASSYDIRIAFENQPFDYELFSVGKFDVSLVNDTIRVSGMAKLTGEQTFDSITDSDVVGFRFAYSNGLADLYLGYPRYEGAGVDNFIWVNVGYTKGQKIKDYTDITIGSRSDNRDNSFSIYDFSVVADEKEVYSFGDGETTGVKLVEEDTVFMNNKTKMKLPLKDIDMNNFTVGVVLEEIHKSAKQELVQKENGVGWSLGFDERGYPKFVLSDGNKTVTVKGKAREKEGKQRLVAKLSREDNTACIYLNGGLVGTADITGLGDITTDADLIVGDKEVAFYSLKLWDEALPSDQAPTVMNLGFSGYTNNVEWGLWHIGVQSGGPPPPIEDWYYDTSLLNSQDVIEYTL